VRAQACGFSHAWEERRGYGELMPDKTRRVTNVYGNRRKWWASKDPFELPWNEKGWLPDRSVQLDLDGRRVSVGCDCSSC
jgi:hypothetical protein